MGVDAMHLGLFPISVPGPAIPDYCSQQIVTVAKYVSGHRDRVAAAPFGGEAAVVDRRRGVLDVHARRRLRRRTTLGWGSWDCSNVGRRHYRSQYPRIQVR
jgi:hypothetical protein